MESLNISTEVIDRLRNVIVENFHHTSQISLKNKKQEHPSWNFQCVIMDRIADIVVYLQSLVPNLIVENNLNTKTYFELCNFMNHTTVLFDCIDTLTEIYSIDITEETIFFSARQNYESDHKKNTNQKYFEYLRSLCSVHPLRTDRHEIFQEFTKEYKFESCAFVKVNDEKYQGKYEGEFLAYVYTGNSPMKIIEIHLSELYAFINYKYSRLEYVADKVVEIVSRNKEIFMHQVIKAPQDFKTYPEYLEMIQNEVHKRYGEEVYELELEFFRNIFFLECDGDNEKQELLTKFKKSIQLIMEKFHRALQDMNDESLDIVQKLYCIPTENTLYKEYQYEINKVLCWEADTQFDAITESSFKKIESILADIFTFFELNDKKEVQIWLQIILYFANLEIHSELNKIIPNELSYRNRILSEQELENFTKDINQQSDISIVELDKILENIRLGINTTAKGTSS
ncbi:MAG: hypothetical protein ACRDD4_12155 [Culicoidibacterales bacterium]